MTSSPSSDGNSIAIIGGGISGIILSLHLISSGITNFVIYERDSDFGGTWLTNTYPGCRCDIPAHWYSYSKSLNPEWSMTHPPQSEILEYWQELAEKNGLRKYARFNTGFVTAAWDDEEKEYIVTIRKNVDVNTHVQDVGHGAEEQDTVDVRHRYLVSAVGGFSQPLVPNIKGLPVLPYAKKQAMWDQQAAGSEPEPKPVSTTTGSKTGEGEGGLEGEETYEGIVVHAARYPRDGLDLKGKKVAVLGNGSSGSQIVPAISEDPEVHVYPLVRSGQWYFPGKFSHFSQSFRQRLSRFRILLRLYRLLQYVHSEVLWYLIFPLRTGFLRGHLEKQLLKRLADLAPADCVELLKPNFPLGGKRIINDLGYLEALNRENVHPIKGRIKKFTKKGIVTEDGEEQEVDVVILATGFDVSGGVLDIKSRNGSSFRDTLSAPDGAQAYHGMSAPGFPNHYVLLGHNTAPGHASVLYPIEVQAEYISKSIVALSESGVTWSEPKVEPTKKYNEWLDKRLTGSVWSKTVSFYRFGPNRDGKIFTNWPGPVFLYWLQNRTVKWDDWTGSPEIEKLQQEQKKQNRRMKFGVLGGLVVIAGIVMKARRGERA